MNPAYPDIVGEWARCVGVANDNCGKSRDEDDDFVEIFLLEIARREIDATRAW